jgi:hypothetical protein
MPQVAGPDDRTVDLSPDELAGLERWSQEHRDRRGFAPTQENLPPSRDEDRGPGGQRDEVGLRVCPRCGKPVHLGAGNCRHCGAAVPRR